MDQRLKILSQETPVSIRELQKNPSAVLHGVVRIMKGSKTLGFFFSETEFKKLFHLPIPENPEAFYKAAYERGDIIDDEPEEYID